MCRYVLRNKPEEWNDQLRGCVMDAYGSVLELLGMMQVCTGLLHRTYNNNLTQNNSQPFLMIRISHSATLTSCLFNYCVCVPIVTMSMSSCHFPILILSIENHVPSLRMLTQWFARGPSTWRERSLGSICSTSVLSYSLHSFY